MKPQQPGHAQGWKWREEYAGQVTRPWAWSEINGGEDLPAHVNGLCELGWHTDCPQAPLTGPAGPGQCSCPCHHQREDRPMTQTPTPEEFLAQTEPDEEDIEELLLGVVQGTEPSPFDWPNGPLESIAESLRTIAGSYVQVELAETEDGQLRTKVADLEAELSEIEALHDAKQQLIEDVLAICKPSTSKLANAVRAVLEPVVVPSVVEPHPARTSAETHGGYTSGPSLPSVAVMGGTPVKPPEQPAPDADVEEWRNYARQEAPGATDVDQMNRSQIRTLLGISHVEGASS